MAQFETSIHKGKTARRFPKKRKALFVDLTPMVDLAFLLITFFMLTVSMTEHHNIPLEMPETEGPDMVIRPECMLTIIADKENTIWYYNGDAVTELNKTDYADTGLRQLLYDNMQRVNANYKKDDLVCIIKLTDDANYQNMISILDEILITDIKHYAVQDLTEAELNALKIKSGQDME